MGRQWLGCVDRERGRWNVTVRRCARGWEGTMCTLSVLRRHGRLLEPAWIKGHLQAGALREALKERGLAGQWV